MGFAEIFVKLLVVVDTYYFQTNCRGGPSLKYYLQPFKQLWDLYEQTIQFLSTVTT